MDIETIKTVASFISLGGLVAVGIWVGTIQTKVTMLHEGKKDTDTKLADLKNDMTKVLTILDPMKDVPERLTRIETVMKAVAQKNGIPY
jgi:hypothetical protein